VHINTCTYGTKACHISPAQLCQYKCTSPEATYTRGLTLLALASSRSKERKPRRQRLRKLSACMHDSYLPPPPLPTGHGEFAGLAGRVALISGDKLSAESWHAHARLRARSSDWPPSNIARFSFYALYEYPSTNTDAEAISQGGPKYRAQISGGLRTSESSTPLAGAHFTCFTSTKAQILTARESASVRTSESSLRTSESGAPASVRTAPEALWGFVDGGGAGKGGRQPGASRGGLVLPGTGMTGPYAYLTVID
jgi:hypothetical protein